MRLLPCISQSMLQVSAYLLQNCKATQDSMGSPFTFAHDAPQFLTVRRGHMLEVASASLQACCNLKREGPPLHMPVL